jgi:hypothetical protein
MIVVLSRASVTNFAHFYPMLSMQYIHICLYNLQSQFTSLVLVSL